MNISTMTKAQLEELVLAQAKQLEAKKSGLVVKRNKVGGVYITHQNFRADKKDGSGDYQAGMNLSDATARALFGDKELLGQVVELVSSLPKE